MSRHIFLDSWPLGTLSNPARSPDVIAITNWSIACLSANHKLYIPEVIDYELRRELLCAGKLAGIAKLDAIQATFEYVPLTTPAMLRAADLWAQARRGGYTTGDPKRLDVDVILAAQALTASGIPIVDLVVATTNVAHISRFVTAALWTNIPP